MKIKNLKDLKEAMKDIPDKILEDFGVGVYEDEFVELLNWGDNPEDEYLKYVEMYPQLEDIGQWIENISKVQDQFTTHEEYVTDEPISSKDKIEIKPKTPIRSEWKNELN